MLPQIAYPDPYLCTYYAFMAVLVVSLIIRMLWYPSVELVTEINTVITRAVIYFNIEILGYSNIDFFTSLEAAFLSEKTLLSITLLCTSFILYLASSDILSFVSSYFACFPTCETLHKVKKFADCIIEELLSLIGIKKAPKYKSRMYSRHNSR